MIMLVTFFFVIDDIFSQEIIVTQHDWGVDVCEQSLQLLHLCDDDFKARCLHMATGPKAVRIVTNLNKNNDNNTRAFLN